MPKLKYPKKPINQLNVGCANSPRHGPMHLAPEEPDRALKDANICSITSKTLK